MKIPCLRHLQQYDWPGKCPRCVQEDQAAAAQDLADAVARREAEREARREARREQAAEDKKKQELVSMEAEFDEYAEKRGLSRLFIRLGSLDSLADESSFADRLEEAKKDDRAIDFGEDDFARTVRVERRELDQCDWDAFENFVAVPSDDGALLLPKEEAKEMRSQTTNPVRQMPVAAEYLFYFGPEIDDFAKTFDKEISLARVSLREEEAKAARKRQDEAAAVARARWQVSRPVLVLSLIAGAMLVALVAVPIGMAVFDWGAGRGSPGSQPPSQREATESASSPPSRAPRTAEDEAIDLVTRELNAQMRGETCLECWVAQPDGHAVFKNLLGYRMKGTFRCRHSGQAIDGLQGVRVNAQAQNSFGAASWNLYEALAVRQAGQWKLADLGEVRAVEGQELDVCMMAGASGMLERYGLVARTPADSHDAAAAALEAGVPPASPAAESASPSDSTEQREITGRGVLGIVIGMTERKIREMARSTQLEAVRKEATDDEGNPLQVIEIRRPAEKDPTIVVELDRNTASRIRVHDPKLRTKEGAYVGMDLSELMRLYVAGETVWVEGQYYVPHDTQGVVFKLLHGQTVMVEEIVITGREQTTTNNTLTAPYTSRIEDEETPPEQALEIAKVAYSRFGESGRHQIAVATNTRGYRLLKASQIEQARPFFEFAVSIDEAYGMPKFNLARIYALSGDVDNCIKFLLQLRTIGRLGPGRLKEIGTSDAFNKVRGDPRFEVVFRK